MGEETQPKEISLGDYVWGTIVANASVGIVNSFRGEVQYQHPLVQMLLFGLAAFGGAFLAAYSIARKTGQTYQKAGLTTGLLSYIAYFVLSLFTGFQVIPIFLEDAVTLTGFVVGGILGPKYWKKRSS